MGIFTTKIRELTAHKINGLNEALRIFVFDEPGAGNACHDYVVLVPSISKNTFKDNTPDDLRMTEAGETVMFGHTTNGDHLATITKPIEQGGGPAKVYEVQDIIFQNGPIKEKGYNGNSHEALLAILLDRMESFQAGPYACHDNQMALDHLQGARLWLHKRTMDRMARQVEGTHQK